MDTGLNINNGGQRFELQFQHIDSSTYESPASYIEAGPTRNRRSRPHLTPYSRNNSNHNRLAQAEDTSKTWLSALIKSILPSFMSNFLGLTSRREGRRSETTLPRLNQNNGNEMDIDQRHETSNGIQERLVQSNRIFGEPIQPINNVNGRRRSGIAQNNAIKRKRPEESSTSIEAVEEKLRRQAQIEDQNHKPDLKELYYKNIDPNWYKPFKNNPDNYPKFASSSKVTSDTYGPDPNLNLSKESPPLKKFKPSVIPTPRWFDYYPDRNEDMIDRRRTENIVERREVEEKTIEKEKASLKFKKGKGRAIDINLENGKEKPGKATSTSPVHISPLKDQNYFANIQTPVAATSSKIIFPPNGIIENQPQIPSTVISPSKISSTVEDKEKRIVTTPVATPDTATQNVKSPSSMESIEYTHENKDDNKSNLKPTSVNATFATEDKVESLQSTPLPTKNINNSSLFTFQKNQPQTLTPLVPIVPKPKSDVLVNSNKGNERISVSLSIEPSKGVEAQQEATPLTTQQEDSVGGNSISLLSEDKDQSLSSTPLTSNNDATSNNIFSSSFFNNLKDKAQPSIPVTLATPFSDKNSTDGEKEKREVIKTPGSQPQANLTPDLKENGQKAVTTIPSFFAKSLSTTDKVSPFAAFASTTVPTTASTSGQAFASTTIPTTASTSGQTFASTTIPTTASTSGPAFASTTVPTTASTSGPAFASTTVPTIASTSGPAFASTIVPTTASTSGPAFASTTVPTTASTSGPAFASTTVSTTASTPGPAFALATVPTTSSAFVFGPTSTNFSGLFTFSNDSDNNVGKSTKSYKPYNNNPRNKKMNKRVHQTLGPDNEMNVLPNSKAAKTTSTDQSLARLQLPHSGTFDFCGPSSASSSASSIFGSGSENTLSQPTFNFGRLSEIQASAPVFGTSNPPSLFQPTTTTPITPIFGSNQTSTTGFNTNSTQVTMYNTNATSASTATFNFGSGAPTSIGFTNPVFGANSTPGSFFNASQNSTAATGFGTQTFPSFNIQNGQSNNLFQPNMMQQSQQIGFGFGQNVLDPSKTVTNNFSQQNQQSFDFNFGGGNSGVNPNPNMFNHGSGSDIGQQGNQLMLNGSVRKIKTARSRRR